MSEQKYGPEGAPLSAELHVFIREDTRDRLYAYLDEHNLSLGVVVELALQSYLSQEIAHLRNVLAMQQEQIAALLKTHDQP